LVFDPVEAAVETLMAASPPEQRAGKDVLGTLFASKARAAVLRLFMLDPSRAYYQRQIENATGLAIRAVQRELERLSSVGLLYRRTEGNRAYYQVDMHHPLFAELRNMILKTCGPVDRLRGLLALDDSVVLALMDPSEERVLAVTAHGERPEAPVEGAFALEVMSPEEFVAALSEGAGAAKPYLESGVDLLGRRDDVIWRRIEALELLERRAKPRGREVSRMVQLAGGRPSGLPGRREPDDGRVVPAAAGSAGGGRGAFRLAGNAQDAKRRRGPGARFLRNDAHSR
jgi:hypothetical protein